MLMHIGYLIHDQALVVAHGLQGDPEVLCVTLVVLRLQLVQVQEAFTS